MYRDESLKKYLDDLSAKLPAPGGGSAAALNAGLGIALVSMVLNFTMGKPKYSQYENELKGALERSEKLRNEFLRLVDADVQAYQSKDIRQALDVPLSVARLCFEGAQLIPELIAKTNVNLISDLACAASLLESAFSAAMFNIEINLKGISHEQPGKSLREELSKKGQEIKNIRLTVEERIGKIIRG